MALLPIPNQKTNQSCTSSMQKVSYEFKEYSKNKNGSYGPNENNHYYLPVTYHSKNAKPNPYKSRWCITENEEYCVFCYADINNFKCSKNKSLYAVINNCRFIFGKNTERIAKFPIPNCDTPFHGYPVHSENISEELLELWIQLKIITESTRRRIAQCKI